MKSPISDIERQNDTIEMYNKSKISIFAGTEEAPGELELYQGRSFKTYRGMGSIGAMSAGSSNRYFQKNFKDKSKFVPEGVDGRVEYKGKVSKIIYQLKGGLRSSICF